MTGTLHLQGADISTLQSTEADLFDSHDVCRLLVQGLVDLETVVVLDMLDMLDMLDKGIS